MSNPLAHIAMAACELKAASPNHFKTFCDTLRDYELSCIQEILASDTPNDVFRAQGKAKAIQALRKHIVECFELRDTFTRRAQNA